MRPPLRPNERSITLRDLTRRALDVDGLNRKNRARVTKAVRLLEAVPMGRGSAMDLGLRTTGEERLHVILTRAMQRADLDDTQISRLKDAFALLQDVQFEGESSIDDLLPSLGRQPPQPDVDLRPSLIEAELFDGILQAELAKPNLGTNLGAVANGALAGLRDEVPDLFPDKPLSVGDIGPALPLRGETLERLSRLAAGSIAFPAADDPAETEAILWDDGTSELLVFPGKVRTTTTDRILTVIMPVVTDAGETEMTIPFAIGSKDRVAGLLAAAPDRPRGDPLIAEVWGEALIAFAYKMILEIADKIAGASGRDAANNRLVAQSLSLEDGALVIQPQAGFRLKGGGR